MFETKDIFGGCKFLRPFESHIVLNGHSFIIDTRLRGTPIHKQMLLYNYINRTIPFSQMSENDMDHRIRMPGTISFSALFTAFADAQKVYF